MYKISNQIKGIVKLNSSGNWELVADCPLLTRQQLNKIVDLLNDA